MPAEHDFSKVSALVVEDEGSGIALIGRFLRRLGIETMVDTTGKHAVQLARSMKPRPDVIFLDLHLPECSGFDVLKEVRQARGLEKTRVIALTALDPYEAIPMCRDAGFDGFISKPFSIQLLVRQLNLILAGETIWGEV